MSCWISRCSRAGRSAGHLDDLFSLQRRIAFDMATQVDPDLFHNEADSEVPVRTTVGEAHQSLLAYWSIKAAGQGWVKNPRDVTTLAGGRACSPARSVQPRAIAVAGHVGAYLLHDLESALHLHARATELNSNLPIARIDR